MAQERIRFFFQNVFCNSVWSLAQKIVRFLEMEEEIRHAVGLFECIASPGCCGLVDCAHLIWEKCPAG